MTDGHRNRSGRPGPRALAAAATALVALSAMLGGPAGGGTAGGGTAGGVSAEAGPGAAGPGPPGPSTGPLVAVGAPGGVPAGARAVGPVAASTSIHLEVVLRPRDPTGLAAFAQAVSEPDSPDHGHYLAPGAFAHRFGPAPSASGSLRSGLSSLGLHAGATSADGLLLSVSAPAGTISAALHVALEQYRLATGRLTYANERAPLLAPSLAAAVESVSGLSDTARALPLGAAASPPTAGRQPAAGTAGTGPEADPATPTGGPAPCKAAATAPGGYTWNKLATAYGFTTAYGAGHLGRGETVGLFELQAYRSTDVAGFESCYTLPSGASWGSVGNVVVDGGPGAEGTAGAGYIEPILDIEDVLGLAPEADVLVYGAPNTNDGLLEDYDRMVTDDRAQVISTSWGECETTATNGVLEGEDEIFEEAATQGQTVVAASGDQGSADCDEGPGRGIKTQLAVDDPASQPFVTGVGGTELLNPTTTPTETSWTGGGGVSLKWAKPAWQTVAGSPSPTRSCTTSPGASATSTSCRQVPDVSASADPEEGDLVYSDGRWEPIGGTSAAAPLWGAMAALADQGCAAPVGFLDPRLYALGEGGDVHDVTVGSNDNGNLHPGHYTAGAGYDNATGWGTPAGAQLLGDACQGSVASPTLTPHSVTAGAPGTTYHVGFTTPATGALTSGDTVTMSAPAGSVLPATSADYGVGDGAGSVPVASVSLLHTDGSSSPDAAVVTLGGPVPGGTAVTLVVHGVTNTTLAGQTTLFVATTTDPVPAPVGVTVVAGPVSAVTSEVSAAAPSTVANGTASDTVTVTARDSFGNVVRGATVSLSANPGAAASVSPLSGSTGTGGSISFGVSDATTETVTLTATVTTTVGLALNQTPTVDFTRLTDGQAALTPAVAGAATTITASFTTSSAGALGPGSTLTLLAPAGTRLPSPIGDYSVAAGTGSATVASVVTAAVDASTVADKATVTLGASTLAADDAVTLGVTGATAPTVAGTDHLALSTSADPVPVDPGYILGAARPSPTGSSIRPEEPSVPADGTDTDTVTVRVGDAFANPVAGETVTLTAAGSAAVVSPASAATSATGLATFNVSDGTAQVVSLGATVASGTGPVALGSATMSFTDLSGLTYEPLKPATTTVDTTAGAAVSVTASFNLAGGMTGSSGVITLTAPPGTTLPTTKSSYAVENLDTLVPQSVTSVSVSKGAASTTTNVAAVHITPSRMGADTVVEVTVTGASNPTVAGAGYATVSATGTGNAVASWTTVAISPASATAGTSTVAADPGATVANGTSASVVSVTVRDAFSNPVPGEVVTLGQGAGASTVTGDGSTGQADQSTTSAGGVATFDVTDTTAETVTYSATDTTAGVAVGATAAVAFSAPGAATGPAATVSSAHAGASGATLSATFTTSTTGALPGGVAGAPTITLSAPAWAPLPPASGDYQVHDVTSGTDPVRRVTVAGDHATLTLGGSGVTADDPVTLAVAGLTNPEPAGTFPVTLATSADTVPVTATATVTAATPSPARSSVTATPASVPADGATPTTVTVTERDAFTDPVAGDTVSLPAAAHTLVTPAIAVTTDQGVATFAVTDSVVEDVTLTPTDVTAGVSLDPVTVDFTQPAGRTAVSGVTVTPGAPATAFVAGAPTTYQVTFTTSALGALGPGDSVSLAGPAGTLWPTTPADFELTGSTVASVSGAGTAASPLTVSVGSSAVGDDDTVTLAVVGVSDPTAASAADVVAVATSTDTSGTDSAAYAVVAAAPSPSSAVVVSATGERVGGSVTVTVTELDAFSNPVAGDSVGLSNGAGHATVTPPTATTSAGGVVTFSVTDAVAEDVTLVARDATAEVTFSDQPTVAFVVPRVVGVSVTPTEAVAGAATTYQLTFTTSPAGALGATDTLSLVGPAGTVWPTSATDFGLTTSTVATPVIGDGTAASPLVLTLSSSTVHGGETVTLVIHDVVAEVAEAADVLDLQTSADDAGAVASNPYAVVAGPPSPTSSVSVSASSVQVGDPVTVTVTEVDRFSNPIIAEAVALAPSPGSHARITPPTATTSADGVATFTVTDTVAEDVTLTVTVTPGLVVLAQRPMLRFTAPPPPPSPPPPPPVAATGYWLVASDGGIFSFGDARFFGSTGSIVLNRPIVGMAPTPTGDGYWLVASDGGIFSFGDARFFGSTGSIVLNRPIVGMAPTPTGDGYWLVASDGGIFSFGDARFFGSTGSIVLNRPIVGMAPTPTGDGYWLVASDGGIFSFGDARFFGSTGSIVLNRPIVGMAPTPTGDGYWLVASDGGIFSFGDARFFGSTGSIVLNRPIVGMAPTPTGDGYWLVASDGGIFSFGDARFFGSTGSIVLNRPIVGMAPTVSGS